MRRILPVRPNLPRRRLLIRLGYQILKGRHLAVQRLCYEVQAGGLGERLIPARECRADDVRQLAGFAVVEVVEDVERVLERVEHLAPPLRPQLVRNDQQAALLGKHHVSFEANV